MARKKATRASRPAKRVLLVVDMLNGFLDPAGALFCGKGARRIIPFVRKTIGQYRRRRQPVIFIADSHARDDPEFATWPAHCLRGSWEAQVIPELPVGDSPVIRKRRYSGFFGTRLAGALKALRPELVEVVGVCTNICVQYTVADLRNRDYRVRVLKDGVAGFDPKACAFALEQMHSVLGAEVV